MRHRPVLTVVICFLNEREEVRHTLSSLRETSGDHVEVLLVNDGSDPDYDYRGVSREFGCRYVENPRRLGPAVCRSRGVDQAKTPMVLLLDAHMRFQTAGWSRTIAEAIESNPRALYCTRSPALHADGSAQSRPAGLGAWVRLEPRESDDDVTRVQSLLSTEWSVRRRGKGRLETVPCVLGGAYAFDRRFFQTIGGHLGQVMYGGEEPYISAKAWLAGGACHVLSDVAIAHVYRPANVAPWVNPIGYALYNKMVLLATVFPETRFESYRELFQVVPGQTGGGRDLSSEPAAPPRAAPPSPRAGVHAAVRVLRVLERGLPARRGHLGPRPCVSVLSVRSRSRVGGGARDGRRPRGAGTRRRDPSGRRGSGADPGRGTGTAGDAVVAGSGSGHSRVVAPWRPAA